MNMAFKTLQTVCSGNDAELWKSKLGVELFSTQKHENIPVSGLGAALANQAENRD